MQNDRDALLTSPSKRHPAENVGSTYDVQSHLDAQEQTWQVINAVAKRIRPGHTELDARAFLKEELSRAGCEKSWHPPQIRFGRNTVQPFGKPSSKDVRLSENDIFFLDIGPVFGGYEGDAGATFTLGEDKDLKRLANDAKGVFDEVRDHFFATSINGRELYEFAQHAADRRGWKLSLEGASGHRVSDFPHAIHHRGKLRTFSEQPSPNRWILEIHLFHPGRELGAFYEDLL